MSQKWDDLYPDPEVEAVVPLQHGYEMVGGRKVRTALSPAGKRKHARLRALREAGWVIVSVSGAGLVHRPDAPNHLYSVAAAVREL